MLKRMAFKLSALLPGRAKKVPVETEYLGAVVIAFLWITLGALLVIDVLTTTTITLLPFYTIPALVGAVLFSTRVVVPLAVGGWLCGVGIGAWLGLLTSQAYLARVAAVTGILFLSIVICRVRTQQAQALAQERSRIRATLDSLLDPHVLLTAVRDASGKIIDFIFEDANDAACQFNRIPRKQMIGSSLLQLLPAHVATGLFDLYCRAIETGRPLALDDYLYPHDILGKPVYFDIRAVKSNNGLSFTWRDVTERHVAMEALDQRVRIDELTKLLRRREGLERLEDLQGKAPRTGTEMAVLFVDLDEFKRINDTHGHVAGDAVLLAIAERIRGCFRSTDYLGARVGGDEFMVVLYGVHGIDDALGVAEKIRRSAAAPIAFEGRFLEATVSIGVALAHKGESTAALVARADTAMYQAKQRGRNQIISVETPSVA